MKPQNRGVAQGASVWSLLLAIASMFILLALLCSYLWPVFTEKNKTNFSQQPQSVLLLCVPEDFEGEIAVINDFRGCHIQVTRREDRSRLFKRMPPLQDWQGNLADTL